MEVEKIPINILHSVRLQIDADNNFTISMNEIDEKIKKMTPIELMQKWSKWNIEDETWATQIISRYNSLMEISNE